MSDFLRGTWILFRTHLAFAMRSKRLLVCLLLAAVPVVFAFVMTQFVGAKQEPPVSMVAWMLIGQVVCPLTALVFASALVSEDVEDRTITYLFSRPIPRASLLFGRWIASMLLIAILLSGTTLATLYFLAGHFTSGDATGPWLEVASPMLSAVIVGAAAYTAVFAALGTVVKYPMILGLLYVGVFDVLLVNFPLPGNLQRSAVQFHLRSVVKGSGVEAWSPEWIFGNNELIPPSDAYGVLGIAIVVALAVGAFAVTRRQFELSS